MTTKLESKLIVL